MLLVDDRQPQRVEGRGLLHQRVRADDQVDLPRRDLARQVFPRRRRHAAGDELDAEARPGQQPSNRLRVLLGQDLGRRHEGGLQPVLHRQHGGQHRDDGLAGADIALQQAVHRLGALHVLADLLEGGALTGRQLERQHAAQRLANAIVDANGVSLALGIRLAPPQQQPHLEAEELFEDQPALRGRSKQVELVKRRVHRREVRQPQRVVPGWQAQARAHLGRQRIGQVRRPAARAPRRPACAASSG